MNRDEELSAMMKRAMVSGAAEEARLDDLIHRGTAPSSLAGGAREVVARIVDPFAWRKVDRAREQYADHITEDQRREWSKDPASLAKADAILAALSPEAPAREGAGESVDDVSRRLFAVQYPDRDYDDLNDRAKIGWMRKAWSGRARSSAPEAREDYSSLIAARCVALPGKLIDCPVCLAVDNERDRQAAPSADKLREVLIDLTSWFTKPVQGQNGMVWVIPAGERGADDALNAALAALEAEGA